MHNPISWHIEPTSRCTLECPGCDRTWFKKTFGHQIIQDIDIDALGNFFSANNFTQSQIILCGNNGDPIYHPDFTKLITVLKSQNHVLTIYTNGSAKTSKFWQEVCNCLDEKDQIVFAIDGLEDTNSHYRKNSNWQQIMGAVKTCVKEKINTEWQFIVFKHNQHQIQNAQYLCKKLGVSSFKLIKSHRWLDESLHQFMPDEKYVNQEYSNQMETIYTNKNKSIIPRCMKNKEIFIDSKGDIYPCCWSASYRFQHKHIFGKNPINIRQQIYSLSNEHIKFLNNAKSWNSAQLMCKMHCAKI